MINIDPEINPIEMKVTSLLLQPVINCTIWHSISHLNRSILIKVTVALNRVICVIIEDEDIDRSENKENLSKGPKSPATSATQKETNSLNGAFTIGFTLSIKGIIDKLMSLQGTKVNYSLTIII